MIGAMKRKSKMVGKKPGHGSQRSTKNRGIIYNSNNSPARSFLRLDCERPHEGVPHFLLGHARHIDLLFQFGLAGLIPAVLEGDGARFGDGMGFGGHLGLSFVGIMIRS